MADELLREAFEWASGVMGNVKPDQYDDPTRCFEWTVHMLINHMIGAAHAFAAGVPTGTVSPQVDPAIDLTDGDAGATYAAAWPGVLAVWAGADPEGLTQFPFGLIPNFIARQLLLMESAVHGSDLAAATGQDSAIPGRLAEAVLALGGMLFADPTNRGHDFAPPFAVADDASASDKAVALLGRQP